MKQWLVNVLLVLASSVCGIAAIEVGWRFLESSRSPSPAETDYDRRYMLFGAGGQSAFRNVGDFFTYRPDSVIHSATYYDTDEGMVREYEYEFYTNNLGLVQRERIVSNKPSVLILGDSFTEGQGAEPWFEQIAPFFRAQNYQPVNGGLLGTGTRQWVLLHDYLKARHIDVRKLVVVLISDDYVRPVWNFPERVLACLADYRICVGDEDFHGMPPDAHRPAFLEKLRKYRTDPDWKGSLKSRLPATAVAYRQARRLADGIRERLNALVAQSPSPESAADDSLDAKQIRYFFDMYGKDVVFVHIPDRNELKTGPEESGVLARAQIRMLGAKFFDGFERCGLTRADYHVNDGHPNAAGYAKIAVCVREAAKEIM
jgi:hypothetical protein